MVIVARGEDHISPNALHRASFGLVHSWNTCTNIQPSSAEGPQYHWVPSYALGVARLTVVSSLYRCL